MIFHVETSHLIYGGANKMTIFIYFYLWRLQIYSSGPGNYPANIYLFKVNNRDIRKRCEICSKLTIKIPERRQ